MTRAGLQMLGVADVDPANVQKMDSIKYIGDIQKIGSAYAAQHVSAVHFKGFL